MPVQVLSNFVDTAHFRPGPRGPAKVLTHNSNFRSLKRVGDEGVLAVVCDSTNVFVPGRSGSESDVGKNLEKVIAGCKGRVAVTSFASNVARMQSVIKAGAAAKRHVALVGRSMHKISSAAIETGYLKDIPSLIDEESAANLPPHKVLYLCTGSQGEARAALSRIAVGDHPHVSLGPGDTVIFSSRVIPGNERLIYKLQNDFSMRGVEVISAEDHDVHVSGHPAREELADMYGWLRPQIAVPVHGEERHLMEHVRLAKSLQIPEAIHAPNGSMVRLAPGPATIFDEAPHGRLHLDGNVLTEGDGNAVKERRGLAYAGFVAVTLMLDGRGRSVNDPVVICAGLPEGVEEAAVQAASEAQDKVSRRTDDDVKICEEMRRVVRRAVQDAWGKKPVVKVELVRMG
jgi:ribonuclease J